jgi:3',5'-cyclic AMP phosphodiesterase CpdA
MTVLYGPSKLCERTRPAINEGSSMPPGKGVQPITLLHVSDMQFGKNHRFGHLDKLSVDASFDDLLVRLIDDLKALEKAPGLKPQLVICSGDLAEWGLKSEFEDARRFLEGIAKHLGLAHDRVVIVPGNHDINRKSCEAYFNQCAADETEPVAPFWAKWKQYEAMYQEFYRGLSSPPSFSVEEYWTWYEYTDPKVVVAGMNSTIAEIHDVPENDLHYQRLIKGGLYGHFGWMGEAQLRWFKQKLDTAKKQGIFRIGVVHHNLHRAPVADDENLGDADLLKQYLGDSLNLLLHGHTHNSKIDWLSPNLPVLSTGSAALTKDIRPDEVPNQYQIVQVWPNRLERWTRRFDPGNMRWEADTRCSDNGNDWHVVNKVSFLSIHATFPGQELAAAPEGDDDGESDPLGMSTLRPVGFLDQVETVCKLWAPGADVKPLRGGDSFLYLLVTARDEITVRQSLVGVCESRITLEFLEGFSQNVDAKYRAVDPKLDSKLVYSGEKASQALIDAARQRGIRLLSFVEYQGLIDFGSYWKDLKDKLEKDKKVYPISLYVVVSRFYYTNISLVRRMT